MLVVVGMVLAMLAVAFPMFRPLFAESHILGAARQFKGQFRLAASTAVRSNVYTAIRFERRGDDVLYSVYQDGNHNGSVGNSRAVPSSTSLLGAAHRGRLPAPAGPGLARGPFPGGCLVASIRLDAQAPQPRGPSPILDPPYAVSWAAPP